MARNMQNQPGRRPAQNPRRPSGQPSTPSASPRRPAPPQGAQRAPQAGRRRPVYDEYNRYYEVERRTNGGNRGEERHSTYQSRQRKRRRQESRKRTGRRVVVGLFSLILLMVFAVGGYGFWMLSRLNRQEVDTKQYEAQPSDAPAWSVANADGVMNIMIIGADRNKDGSNGRSDIMMLASIDQKNKKLRLVSFMRDLYLDIPTVGYERLNATFAYGGAALTMQTIENYFRVNIDNYIQTDFENFEKIITKMGGVDVELSKEEAEYMNKEKGWNLQEGVQHLNAEEALYFSRIRELDSDFGRTGRQRQMILCMLETFKKMNIMDMAGVVADYLPYVTTDLSNSDLIGLATLVPDFSNYSVETMYIPYKGTYEDIKVSLHGVPNNQVMKPDVEENAALLREFLYGEEDSSDSSDSSD